MMHRIKNLLLRYPSYRSFHELPALCRSYVTSTAGGSNEMGPGRNFGTKAAAEPFMSGSSSSYIEDMFESWQRDPNSVHKSWDSFFRQTARGAPPGQAYAPPPFLRSMTSALPAALPAHAVEQGLPVDEKTIEDHLSVQSIIRSYQVMSIVESFY
jgi:2-oxoglutarate dehydrogenase E1 component